MDKQDSAGDNTQAAERLVRCIHTRRRRKCIAAGEHQEKPPGSQSKCPRCGL